MGEHEGGQGSISSGMIVRMTSSLPRRTTALRLSSLLMAVLTSLADVILCPLMLIMTSLSFRPPLEIKQEEVKIDLILS